MKKAWEYMFCATFIFQTRSRVFFKYTLNIVQHLFVNVLSEFFLAQKRLESTFYKKGEFL